MNSSKAKPSALKQGWQMPPLERKLQLVKIHE